MANCVKLELFQIYVEKNGEQIAMDMYFAKEKEAIKYCKLASSNCTYKKLEFDVYKSALKYYQDHSYGVMH
ncbi:MAG: hypothetical protein E7359_03675 [Clostridiales bacterium]|nr:hypothetical protein [Clostridiales bacterium]